jgi:hypothetical protein
MFLEAPTALNEELQGVQSWLRYSKASPCKIYVKLFVLLGCVAILHNVLIRLCFIRPRYVNIDFGYFLFFQ